MVIDFPHKQLAHCENGAICNLLNFGGLDISEAMIFGIGSGLFFAYMPFVKNQGIPLTSYRIWPGRIQQNVTKRLGIPLIRKTYKNQQQAMNELDMTLLQGQPAGLLTNLYFLPFFPKSYRFHYNNHNTVIYGKEGDTYFVSDPVLEEPARISYNDLVVARFAKGVLTIRGNMYYPGPIPPKIPIEKAIVKGISSTCMLMVKNPIPFHGISGIRLLLKRIKKEFDKGDIDFINLFLGNIIRMLEETGTGGAGFRYIYSAFLQEAGQKLHDKLLADASMEMTAIGDRWRDFALSAAKVIKNRVSLDEGYIEIKIILNEVADREQELFRRLNKIKFK
jgi:hypothetical protein